MIKLENIKAEKKALIVTAEKIVPASKFVYSPVKADIPHFLVDAVVQVKNGASPCSCTNCYNIDRRELDWFKGLKTKEELKEYLKKKESMDYDG